MIVELDSAIKLLSVYNSYSEDVGLHGLDDIRQETNNVINKLNGWFSFWMGILALVGVLIPAILQLKIQYDNKEKLKSELGKLKVLQLEQEKAGLYADINKLSFTFMSCYDNKWCSNNKDRNQFWNEILFNLNKKTERLVEKVVTGDFLHDDDVIYLKITLMQLYSVYCLFIPTLAKNYKSRQLMVLKKEIGDILLKISNNTYSSVQALRDELELMQLHMNSFHL